MNEPSSRYIMSIILTPSITDSINFSKPVTRRRTGAPLRRRFRSRTDLLCETNKTEEGDSDETCNIKGTREPSFIRSRFYCSRNFHRDYVDPEFAGQEVSSVYKPEHAASVGLILLLEADNFTLDSVLNRTEGLQGKSDA